MSSGVVSPGFHHRYAIRMLGEVIATRASRLLRRRRVTPSHSAGSTACPAPSIRLRSRWRHASYTGVTWKGHLTSRTSILEWGCRPFDAPRRRSYLLATPEAPGSLIGTPPCLHQTASSQGACIFSERAGDRG